MSLLLWYILVPKEACNNGGATFKATSCEVALSEATMTTGSPDAVLDEEATGCESLLNTIVLPLHALKECRCYMLQFRYQLVSIG